jgi:SAM-dependent methyltransferase
MPEKDDMEIKFAQGVNAWKDFNQTIHEIIVKENYKSIAEIGGGANPLLSLDFAQKQKLSYHVIDISPGELSKANAQYDKIMLDLEKKEIAINAHYDFIFSQLTVEHIRDIETFYTNAYKLLKPGGCAYFFFACITTLPAMSNYILPDFISRKLLLFIQPFRKNEMHGKFKAYYKWCFGPTRKNIKRLETLDFEVSSYTGYFGHSYYHRISMLDFFEKTKTAFLLKHPSPHLCSYAQVLLKRNDPESHK